MRKIIIVVFGCTLFMFFLSCQHVANKSSNILSIQIRKENFEKSKTNLSSIIKVTELIPLETSKDCLIGRVDKILISKNRIYVLDKERAKSVFVFNRKGRFINKIISNGKGPSDILAPTDIIIHPLMNGIMVLDRTLGKINTYNEDCVYKETLSLKFHPTHFELIGADKFAFATQGEHFLTITDLQGQILSSYFKYEPDFQMVLMWPFSTYKNELYFLRYIDNNVYRISEESVEPGIFVDFGKYALTREDYLNIPLTGMDRLIDRNCMFDLHNIRINKTHLFFKFSFDDKAFMNIYNKMDGNLFSIAYLDTVDDMFFGGAEIIWISNSFDDHFIGIIEPNKMNPLCPIVFNEVKYEFAIDNNPAIILYDFIIN
jgi:hypothetical protein